MTECSGTPAEALSPAAYSGLRLGRKSELKLTRGILIHHESGSVTTHQHPTVDNGSCRDLFKRIVTNILQLLHNWSLCPLTPAWTSAASPSPSCGSRPASPPPTASSPHPGRCCRSTADCPCGRSGSASHNVKIILASEENVLVVTLPI